MSLPSCSDVCEILHQRLGQLGYTISDDEDHTDLIEALNETITIKEQHYSDLREACRNALNDVDYYLRERDEPVETNETLKQLEAVLAMKP